MLVPAPSRRWVWIAHFLLGLGVAALLLHCFPPSLTADIPAASIQPQNANSYYAPLPPRLSGWMGWLVQIEPDSNTEPSASQLKLLEQGKSFGVPHSVHIDIVEKGRGRYSHWQKGVIFSTPDNSDPRSNGRSYALESPASPSWWVVVVALVGGFALLHPQGPNAARLGRMAFWTGCGVICLYANWAFHALLAAPMVSPDSNTYLTWSLLRTVGYPFILHAQHAAFDTWEYLPLFQLNLLLASLVFLAYATARVCGHLAAGWLVACITLAAGTMLASAADLLTEAAFSAFVMIHVAATILYLQDRRWTVVLVAGLALAAAITIKSIAFVILGPVVLLALCLPAVRTAALTLVLVPAVAAWLLPSAYNAWRYGTFETSHIGGYAMAGHVARDIHPRPGSAYPVEAGIVEQAIAPVLARHPGAFDSRAAQLAYAANEYNAMLWAAIVPGIAKHYEMLRPGEPCTWTGRSHGCITRHTLSINRTLMQLSREAIAAEPLSYARTVATNYVSLWRITFVPGSDFLAMVDQRASYLPDAYDPARNGYRAMLAPLPALRTSEARQASISRFLDAPEGRFVRLVTLQVPSATLVSRLLHSLPLLILAAGLIASALVFGARRLPPPAVAFTYAGLCLNAYFLGTALAQPALDRYSSAMQGIAATLVVLGAWVAVRGARRAILRKA